MTGSNEVDAHFADPNTIPGWAVVTAVVSIILVAALYFALGMPGMDHRDSGSSEGHAAMSKRVSPGEFAARLSDPSAFVINVHEPYAGAIKGTDALVPAEEVLGELTLPDDRTTPILVYCETGAMSARAVNTLMNAGYSDVVELEGGMRAWEATGRRLLERR